MKAKIVGLVGLVWTFLPLTLSAQTSLNVPNDVKNTRFYSDIFNIQRPALSIAGFSDGGDYSKGYGLKQILEMLYNGSTDPLMIDNYNKIVNISKQNLYDPFNPPSGHYTTNPLNIVNDNSNILQSRAFVALARYVLYKNGITKQIPDSSQIAPPYEVALSDLKSAFVEPEDRLLANSNHIGDQVKWTRTVGNYARALDLYLALENASVDRI